MDEQKIAEFWRAFIADTDRSSGSLPAEPPEAWYFCNNEKDANELLQLVLAGTKRGTASLVEAYEREGESLPVAGELSIITDWSGEPHCVIEATRVVRCRFSEVTEEMAAIEGEGDGSLAYWRRGHEWFFGEEMKAWGGEFNEDAEVLFEEFRVIFRI